MTSIFEDAYEKLGPDDRKLVLDIVNPLLDGAPFNPDNATVFSCPVPFYKGFRYLDIADYSQMPAPHRYVLFGPGSAVILDWSNEPIYALNRELPIALTEENVRSYVKFFFHHVKGKQGRFVVVESVDGIEWREEPPPAARKAIMKIIEPLKIVGRTEDGGFILSVNIMFRNALFRSEASVTAGGIIELSRQEVLIEDMPVVDDIFGQ
jgi:hypothetical protein